MISFWSQTRKLNCNVYQYRAYPWVQIWDIIFNLIHYRLESVSVSNAVLTPRYENFIKNVESSKSLIIDARFNICMYILGQSGMSALEDLILKHIDLSVHTYNALYNMWFFPSLHIAAQCGTKMLSRLVIVQNMTKRNYLCVNTDTSNCCTIGDMGWTDIFIIVKINMYTFWDILLIILLEVYQANILADFILFYLIF